MRESRFRAASPHPTWSLRAQVEGKQAWHPLDKQHDLTGPSLHIFLRQVSLRDRVVPGQIHNELCWALPLQLGGRGWDGGRWHPLPQIASDSCSVVWWESAPFNLYPPCTEHLLGSSWRCRDERSTIPALQGLPA